MKYALARDPSADKWDTSLSITPAYLTPARLSGTQLHTEENNDQTKDNNSQERSQRASIDLTNLMSTLSLQKYSQSNLDHSIKLKYERQGKIEDLKQQLLIK